MEGWIKIHRNITKWEWYDDSKTVHLFFHLLLSANHKNGNWRGQEVKRGQFITGLHKLNASTGISIRSLRTCLERLKSTKEVTIKTTTKNSVITIVNYDLYQGSEFTDKPTDKPTTIKRQTNDNQTTTNNNEKKDKNVNNEKKEIFNTWLDYKKESKKDVKNEKTLTALSNRFNEHTLQKCIWVVNNSIENNYAGLFWDNYKQQQQQKGIDPCDKLIF